MKYHVQALRLLVATTIVVTSLSACNSAYDDASTPCGSPRYAYLRDHMSMLKEMELIELDSFDKACDRYLLSNPETNYALIGIVTSVAIAVVLVLTWGRV